MVEYEENKGWYGYKEWGVAGEWFFKSYQANNHEGKFISQWVRPSPFYTGKANIEYFETKEEAEQAINKAA